ncbi:MAG: T9SS type A sorting domain-containing protein [Candidatus Delongbacteria bacterium]
MKLALNLYLLLGCTLAALATDEAARKQELLPESTSRAYLSSSNGIVTVNVSDAGSSYEGRFTIGTAAGERLLYGHNDADPVTSYTRLKVDGVVYGQGPSMSGTYDAPLTLLAGPAAVGAAIVTQYGAGGVTLIQTVTPTVVAGSGTVRIEYDILGDATYHEVSLLLEMDTMVDANDAAPLSTSYGYTAVETCFETGTVPNIWQAFEVGPTQGPDDLVGCGILSGFGATLPDRAAFGQWGSFYNAAFNYVCSGLPYGDSGCLLWWEAGVLQPFQTRHYQTYYGTCDVQVVPGELSLNLGGNTALSCDNGELTPNPFDVNLLVTNTGGDVCHDVHAVLTAGAGLIGGGPVFIGDLAPGQTGAASFSLTALGNPCDRSIPFLIEVMSADCPPNSVTGEVYVPCCEVVGAEEQALAFGLGAAYPNPFNPVTTLSFTLETTGQVELVVHNLAGEQVATLWNGPAERGLHEVQFDASALPSGLYLYTLSTEQGRQTRRMLLTK